MAIGNTAKKNCKYMRCFSLNLMDMYLIFRVSATGNENEILWITY